MLSQIPDKIVTFGDSISDAGVIFGVTDQLLQVPVPLPEPFVTPGYAGVFADGPVYTQRLSELLGADLVGYGVGGARAVGERLIGETLGPAADFVDPTIDDSLRTALLDFDINMDAQVDRFLDGLPAFPNDSVIDLLPEETVAATLFIGLNDFGDFIADADFSNPLILFQAINLLADLDEEIREAAFALAESDVIDQFVLIAPPPFSFFPIPEGISDEEVEIADDVTDLFKDRLEDIVDEVSGEVEAVLLDLQPIAHEMMDDPISFGQTDVGPFYLAGGTVPEFGDVDPSTGLPELSYPTNPLVADTPLDELRFFDALHPSASTHGVFAAYAASALAGTLSVLDDDGATETLGTVSDLVLARSGDDAVNLRKGDDTALGGRGSDTLDGAGGRDLLGGGSGDDLLQGGNHKDLLVGGVGNDTIEGGSGRDLIILGQGIDKVKGQSKGDVFVWVDDELGGEEASAFINGNLGRDKLVVLTDSETKASLLGEIDATTPEDADAGRYTLSSIGVTTNNVEKIVIRDGGIDALYSFSVPDEEALNTADLWGMI